MKEIGSALAIAVLATFGLWAVGVFGQAPRPVPASPIKLERTEGGRYVTISQEGFRDLHLDPKAIVGLVLYDPSRDPDRISKFSVYVQLSATQYRLDCSSEEEALGVVKFLTSN